MANTVYTTDSFVLSARNVGEANRIFTLLTKDIGTITASARSIRLQKSKLRYALQPFSFVEVSLVEGKGGWRITNAYPFENMFFATTEGEKRTLVVKISVLLKRLLVGESPDIELYEVVEKGFLGMKNVSNDHLDIYELVFVSKILQVLGYGTDSDVFLRVSNMPLGENESEYIDGKERRTLIKEINEVLAVSGL
ncbi:MAG: DNA repair protein RecO [Candidatus Campbellbacteria bacterium]|nr:DNA repair protein RecO [Candidatus Campbellbacteria bacterium]